MSTDRDQLQHSPEESRSHYTTPEGYFEALEERIMDRIDAEPIAQEEQSTPQEGKRLVWQRLRPYFYLAASFVLTIGAFRGFQYIRSQYVSSPEVEVQAEAGQEKDMQYYELLAGEYTDEPVVENHWLINTNYIN